MMLEKLLLRSNGDDTGVVGGAPTVKRLDDMKVLIPVTHWDTACAPFGR